MPKRNSPSEMSTNSADIPAAMCTIEIAATIFFTSDVEIDRIAPVTNVIKITPTKQSREQKFQLANMPNANNENFNPNAASSPLVPQLASTCASGSQKAVGNAGVFASSAVENAITKTLTPKSVELVPRKFVIPEHAKIVAAPAVEIVRRAINAKILR